MTTHTSDTTAAASLFGASDVVHQRSRLSILGVLYEVREADFVELRSITRLKDGNLSRHLQVLEEAKLISIHKGFSGKRPRTGVRLTAKGRNEFEEEISILRSVVAGAEAAHAEGKGARKETRVLSRRRIIGAGSDAV